MVYGQITISGVVTDKLDKLPLPGINIVEKGTNNGTVTDTSGYFILQIKDSDAVLVISFVGYKTQEIAVGEDRFLKIQLKPECYLDFFDVKEIGIGMSGASKTPVGAFGYITFPFYSILSTGFDYQSDLSENYKYKIQTGLLHVLADCDYNADIKLEYRKVNHPQLNFENYGISGKLNFSQPRIFRHYTTFYAGYGLSNFIKMDSHYRNMSGYMVGIGTYISKPLFLEVSIKTTYWKEFWELNGEIQHRYRRFLASLNYETIKTYHEMNIRVGWIFN